MYESTHKVNKMLSINTFLQGIYAVVKSISKKAYRTCAIIASGVAIIAVVSMNSKDFGGSGKNNTSTANGQAALSSEKNDEDEDASNVLVQIGIEESMDASFNDVVSLKSVDNFIISFCSNNEIEEETNSTEEERLDNNTSIEESAKVETNVQANIVTSSEPKEEPKEEPKDGTMFYDENGNALIVNKLGIIITENDYVALQRIVEAEAGNQDEIGRMLVANVIINRVKRSSYSNSIYEIIFQKNGNVYQFAPTQNGYYYKVNVSQTTKECVDKVLSGEDHSQGALYFSRSTPANSWFNTSLTFLFEHGDHCFYK